jgi:hypothetical protein
MREHFANSGRIFDPPIFDLENSDSVCDIPGADFKARTRPKVAHVDRSDLCLGSLKICSGGIRLQRDGAIEVGDGIRCWRKS